MRGAGARIPLARPRDAETQARFTICLSKMARVRHVHCMPGLIAIVGRPNVGKSALFNRIVGRRIAIVHDQPGVTRDRVTAEAEWAGRSFTLVDTGGIGLMQREKSSDVIARAALDQVELAIESADVIVLTVNVQDGVVPLDMDVADRLRRSGKPVLVAINKVDTEKAEPGSVDFTRLGFAQMFCVSAIHGEGIEALMDAAIGLLPKGPAEPPVACPAAGEGGENGDLDATAGVPEPLKLAIVGRPNVGKSSIVNALARSERVVVSPVPGTTRDSVDVPLEIESGGIREKYLLIDTAGIRKMRRIDDSVEYFSVMRAEDSVARCDIAILVLDAEAGITEQDKKVADRIVENRKACIVVVNKWDLMEETVRKARQEEIERRSKKESTRENKTMTTLSEFGQWVQEHLFFLDYAPVVFASAKSGFHLENLIEAVRYVGSQLQQTIPTSILNRALRDAVESRQPISSQGHRLKFFYATQVRRNPPTFLLFVNREDLFSPQYRKYLAVQLRRAFGYEGCPLVLVPKARPKSIEPVRARKSAGKTREQQHHRRRRLR